jgi:hypothetical protein
MEDAYGGNRQSSGGKRAPEAIVGTTGIGLEVIATERTRVKDARHIQCLVPAKIVLTSTVNEVLEKITDSLSPRSTDEHIVRP